LILGCIFVQDWDKDQEKWLQKCTYKTAMPKQRKHPAQATPLTIPELRRELAITLFQQGKLSFGKAREMADMDFWAFQQLLGSRGISPHYDLPEYEADLQTIEKLAGE
jgi:predicted HTH domain antitoxin